VRTINGRYLVLCFSLLALLPGCRSIKIHTGPPTDEEATVQSADRGRQVRTDWANRLQSATTPQQAAMLRTFIDSTSARYIRYGFRIADMWRDENRQRGTEVPVAEIRRFVENSTQTELPLLEAYEEVIEFGINEILKAGFFEPRTEELLIRHRDHYIEVYSAVFYPNGSRENFEFRLQTLQARTEEISRELEEELRRYE